MTATPTAPPTGLPGPGWAVVVPVKDLAIAKTRLTSYAAEHRSELALAFAVDTVSAALACPSVIGLVVVTDDADVAAALRPLGAHVVGDRPSAGLNSALLCGADAAGSQFPGAPLAALSADLPALRPAELAAGLRSAEPHATAFVSDVEGIGTTMLTARTRVDFNPRFGHRSRAAHRQLGVVELTDIGLASIRRDVDTEVDLYDARRLGLGVHSLEAVASLELDRSTL